MSITKSEMSFLVRQAEQHVLDKFAELLEPTLLEDLELQPSELAPEGIVRVVLDIDVHDLLEWAAPKKSSRAVGNALCRELIKQCGAPSAEETLPAGHEIQQWFDAGLGHSSKQ